MAILAATRITKTYPGTPAVRDASVSVAEGESLVLLGPSGCGKTTLLRVIAGLEVPDAGTVAVGDRVLTGSDVHVPPEARSIGMVFQEPALFPHLSVAKNVGFGLAKHEIAAGRADEALEMVGLVGFGDRSPGTLSGGQAQRVALARALAPRPRIMLFDEAFSSLDTELRLEVRVEVSRLLRELGITSIFVTHDQEEAFVLGDTVAVMRAGSVLQQGAPDEIYSRPVDPWVAAFVGEANIVPGLSIGAVAETALGPVPISSPISGECRVVVRPEHIELDPAGDGVVIGVDFYGHDSAYRVNQDGVEYVVRAMAQPQYRTGDTVGLTYVGPEVAAFGPDRAMSPVVT